MIPLKGFICLDIDGTITADPFHISEEVIACFEALHEKGWEFLFCTGRPFTFAHKLFSTLSFPFHLSLQNGADLLKMPEKKSLSKEHLSIDILPKLDQIYKEMEEDYLIYAGPEKGDFCYYRPHRFSLQILEHLEVVRSIVSEPWQALEEFSFSEKEAFPLIKALGKKEEMENLNAKLQHFPEVQSTCIKDPLGDGSTYLTLITAKKATKGEILRKLRNLFPGAFLIAAGDDFNDTTMLQEADFSIVMNTAPKEMFPLANLIAESAKDFGIIKALEQATGEKM